MKVKQHQLVRVLIWLGDKLLYIYPEKPDIIFPGYVVYKTNYNNPFIFENKVVHIPTLPGSVNINLKFNAPNTLSLDFISNRDYFIRREEITKTSEFRFLGQIVNETTKDTIIKNNKWKGEEIKKISPIPHYLIPPETLDVINKEYYDEIISILEETYKPSVNPITTIPHTYRQIGELSKEGIPAREIYKSLSWPFILFQPVCPIWVDVLNEDGTWSAVFTGYISSISESYSAGATRKVNISATSSYDWINRIPAYPRILDMLFFEHLLEKQVPDASKRRFLELYFRKLAVKDDESFWPEYWQGKKPLELIEWLVKSFNYRMGVMSPEEASAVETSSTGVNWTAVDYKEYSEKLAKYAFHKFSPVGTWEEKDGKLKLKIEPYYGYNSLRTKEFDHIRLRDKTIDGRTVSVLDSMGAIYVAPELFENLSSVNIIELFQRVIGYSVAYFHPQRQTLAAVLQKFTDVLKLDVYNTPKGDLVIEWPRFNYLPTCPKKPGEVKISKILKLRIYKNHNENYIIKENNAITINLQTQGKVITEYIVKGSPDVVSGMSEFITTTMYSGYGFASPELIMRYGIQEEGSSQLYFALEKSPTEKVMSFANDLANCLLLQANCKNNYNGSATLVFRPDLNLGYTILIPHREYLYLITSISHSWSLGSNFTTSISFSYGHPYDMHITEVPEVFWKYKDLKLAKLNFKSSEVNAYDYCAISPNDLGLIEYLSASELNGGKGICPVFWARVPEVIIQYFHSLSIRKGFDEDYRAPLTSYIVGSPGHYTTYSIGQYQTGTENLVIAKSRLILNVLYVRYIAWVFMVRCVMAYYKILYDLKSFKPFEDAVKEAIKWFFIDGVTIETPSETTNEEYAHEKNAWALLEKVSNYFAKKDEPGERGMQDNLFSFLSKNTYWRLNSTWLNATSIWRNSEKSDKSSRHYYGSAIDINGITYFLPYPSVVLAFLLFMDILMLTRPIFHTEGTEETGYKYYGSWFLIPSYGKADDGLANKWFAYNCTYWGMEDAKTKYESLDEALGPCLASAIIQNRKEGGEFPKGFRFLGLSAALQTIGTRLFSGNTGVIADCFKSLFEEFAESDERLFRTGQKASSKADWNSYSLNTGYKGRFIEKLKPQFGDLVESLTKATLIDIENGGTQKLVPWGLDALRTMPFMSKTGTDKNTIAFEIRFEINNSVTHFYAFFIFSFIRNIIRWALPWQLIALSRWCAYGIPEKLQNAKLDNATIKDVYYSNPLVISEEQKRIHLDEEVNRATLAFFYDVAKPDDTTLWPSLQNWFITSIPVIMVPTTKFTNDMNKSYPDHFGKYHDQKNEDRTSGYTWFNQGHAVINKDSGSVMYVKSGTDFYHHNHVHIDVPINDFSGTGKDTRYDREWKFIINKYLNAYEKKLIENIGLDTYIKAIESGECSKILQEET